MTDNMLSWSLLTYVLVVQSGLTLVSPWTVARQAPLSMAFSRQEYWSGVPFSSPGDLPDLGIKPWSSALQEDSLLPEPPGKPMLTYIIYSFIHHQGLCMIWEYVSSWAPLLGQLNLAHVPCWLCNASVPLERLVHSFQFCLNLWWQWRLCSQGVVSMWLVISRMETCMACLLWVLNNTLTKYYSTAVKQDIAFCHLLLSTKCCLQIQQWSESMLCKYSKKNNTRHFITLEQ